MDLQQLMEHQLFDNGTVPRSMISPLEADNGFTNEPPSFQLPDLDLDFNINELSGPAPAKACWSGLVGSGSHKKLDHNAYERDRRMQLNQLYSTLRSLIPNADHTVNHSTVVVALAIMMKYLHIMTDVYLPIWCGMQKKLSIPTTVCQVLDYIPKLQKQVEDLEKRKQELTRAKCRERLQCLKESTCRIVSATPLDGNEIMVQVSLLSNMAASLPPSKCINIFENEGLHLISSSTFSTLEVNRTFYSFHFQV
ncbi:protein IRON-RELATED TRANSCRIPTION FACTOR 2-like [Hordeum vulgare subsp. vulgare]|uniref:protein IRON-RELATED TRANSCRIPTION FACTOR 2-like n=1 Tax=Hordeum vulgare subsp. vulgare TaxID=112509 RepID=UPI001D1A3828|nr:protein IRON-RELATED TRANSCRIPTION FACTOR 2-like [Hordeum vulgare subsp. vulgare]